MVKDTAASPIPLIAKILFTALISIQIGIIFAILFFYTFSPSSLLHLLELIPCILGLLTIHFYNHMDASSSLCKAMGKKYNKCQKPNRCCMLLPIAPFQTIMMYLTWCVIVFIITFIGLLLSLQVFDNSIQNNIFFVGFYGAPLNLTTTIQQSVVSSNGSVTFINRTTWSIERDTGVGWIYGVQVFTTFFGIIGGYFTRRLIIPAKLQYHGFA